MPQFFHGKHGARSLHFVGLVAFGVFTVLHGFMVLVHDVPKEAAGIVPANQNANGVEATIIGCAGLVLILIVHIVNTWFSLRYRHRTQRNLGWPTPSNESFPRPPPPASTSAAGTSPRTSG